MKTTVDIPTAMLKEAIKHSKATTKRDAVVAALDDYNRRRRQAALIKHLGTFKDFITPEELAKSRSIRVKQHGVG